MTRPTRYILRMLAFLALVAAACIVLAQGLVEAFFTSPFLNGAILGVMALGLLHIFRQVLLLRPEVAWLERLASETKAHSHFPQAMGQDPPARLLGPMARMLSERRGRLALSTTSMRTLLDGIQNRIDEAHDLSRYLVGLLIFLGLLGTFWGLSQTVGAVGNTIGGLEVDGSAPGALFERLKRDLEQPLAGMGTAFTSSLFGLASSLVVGFLELQSSQAHARFMHDLEEWLSGVTKLSSGSAPVAEGEGSVPAYIQALLEQTADSLDALQRIVARGEEDRQATSRSLALLGERLGMLTAQTQQQQSILINLADVQSQLRGTLQAMVEGRGAGGFDEASRHHIRNASLYLERLANDVENGRAIMVQEIRNEIRLLARTIAARASEQR